MPRKALWVVAAVLLLPALLSAYTIVLKNGRRLEAQRRYVVEGSLARYLGPDGQPHQVPLAEIDVAATERANPPAETPQRPKVWTNDDLERLREEGAINVVGAAAPAAPAAGAAEEEGGEASAEEKPQPKPPKEETPEYWQERLKPLRDELAQIDKQLQQLRAGQKGQASSNAISLTADNPGVQVEDTIRQLEKRRTDLQQQIENIQLEAKRKGIDPGYLR